MRDLVVVGASAGGVSALQDLVAGLPHDLPATVLVGLHLSQEMPSVLPALLARRTGMEVVAAVEGMPLLPGRVIVAVPDQHLVVVDEKVVLGHGAKENGARPSHDVMLRSAALMRGPRTIGVVLTGLLDDGSAGLACVRRYGGACLVQDPATAAYADMPRNALLAVPDAVPLPLDQLAEEVTRMVASEPPASEAVDALQRERDLAELASALNASTRMPDGTAPGEPSPFACPDCHGVLNRIPDGDVLRYRCRTGHAWNGESLIAQQDESVEEALWTALRALEERADLSKRMADRAEEEGRTWSSALYRRRHEETHRSVSTLRDLLDRSFTTE